MAGESKTSERRLKAHEKQIRALELRKEGYTFKQIGKKLGYRSLSGPYDAVMKALKETLREPAQELRDLEAERLDAIQNRIWGNTGPDKEGLQGIDRLLRIMERRAKLLGLDLAKDILPPAIVGPFVIVRGPASKEEAERLSKGNKS